MKIGQVEFNKLALPQCQESPAGSSMQLMSVSVQDFQSSIQQIKDQLQQKLLGTGPSQNVFSALNQVKLQIGSLITKGEVELGRQLQDSLSALEANLQRQTDELRVEFQSLVKRLEAFDGNFFKQLDERMDERLLANSEQVSTQVSSKLVAQNRELEAKIEQIMLYNQQLLSMAVENRNKESPSDEFVAAAVSKMQQQVIQQQ